jgi:hypothetical protein
MTPEIQTTTHTATDGQGQDVHTSQLMVQRLAVAQARNVTSTSKGDSS